MLENTPRSTDPQLIGRRLLLAGFGALAATPALSAVSLGAEAGGLLDYEARLRGRLLDAGGGDFRTATEQQLLALTNNARLAQGVQECVWSEELARAARAHAADLAGRVYVEHLTPEGFDPSHRVALLARRMIGSASENIAYRRSGSPASATDLMETWHRSPPHWSNVLRPRHERVGFGVVARGERTYAVGLYSRPDGELGAPLPFRLGREADLAGALSQASPRFESFDLTNPLDEQAGLRPGDAPSPTRLPPGLYQLRPRRQVDALRYQVLWGPIFVRV
jgi:uncharacterized protein YkwD